MTTTAASPNHNLTLTRIFDARRSRVFLAWADAAQLARWWGPRGFTCPVCKMDVCVGGAIQVQMQAPDGTVYPMTGIFQQIVPPEKLVFTSSVIDSEGGYRIEILHTVTYEEAGGKTKVTLHAEVIRSTPAGDEMLKGQYAGWSESLERLEELLKNG